MQQQTVSKCQMKLMVLMTSKMNTKKNKQLNMSLFYSLLWYLYKRNSFYHKRVLESMFILLLKSFTPFWILYYII